MQQLQVSRKYEDGCCVQTNIISERWSVGNVAVIPKVCTHESVLGKVCVKLREAEEKIKKTREDEW